MFRCVYANVDTELNIMHENIRMQNLIIGIFSFLLNTKEKD